MAGYHFYRVDRHGHSWVSPEFRDCAGDEEAVAHAKQIITGYVIEVRQADRVVARVEPEV
jgi:hypothetical protein